MDNLETKILKVKNHLLQGKSITLQQSIKLFRHSSIARTIYALRHKHDMNITCEMKEDENGAKYGVWSLKECEIN